MRLFAVSVLYVLVVWSEVGFGGVSGAVPAVSTDRAAEPMRTLLATDKSGGAAKRLLWARVGMSFAVHVEADLGRLDGGGSEDPGEEGGADRRAEDEDRRSSRSDDSPLSHMTLPFWACPFVWYTQSSSNPQTCRRPGEDGNR